MATVASVDTALKTAVLAGTTATVAKANNGRKDFSIASGATYIFTMAVVAGRDGDSNTSRDVGSFAVTVAHMLSDPTDANTYLTGNAVADQKVLMVSSFYRALTGVYEVVSVPELDVPERIGNVIEYTITVQLSIVP